MHRRPWNYLIFHFRWSRVIAKAALVSAASLLVELVISAKAHWGLVPGIYIATFAGVFELSEALAHELCHSVVLLVAGKGAEIEVGLSAFTNPRDANISKRLFWLYAIAGPIASTGFLTILIVVMTLFEKQTLGSLIVVAFISGFAIVTSVFYADGDIGKARAFSRL